MLLHLLPDDKFIDYAIDQFETVYPDRNLYVVTGSNPGSRLKHVTRGEKTIFLPDTSSEFLHYLRDKPSLAGIVVHFLDKTRASILRMLPKETPAVWMIWGGDAYGLTNYILYDEPTTAFLSGIEPIRRRLNNALKTGLHYFMKGQEKRILIWKRNRSIRSLLDRFTFISTVVPNEFQIFKTELRLRAQYLPFSYGSIEDYRPSIGSKIVSDGHILVGNSANPTNNHLTALRMLADLNLENRSVIVPLSYGGPPSYISHIVREGTKLFGAQFRPLLDFMPKEQYSQILTSCGHCIMNQYRQQGLGNLISLLWNGAHIFVKQENPLYTFLSGLGIAISTVDSLANSSSPFCGLTSFERGSNQALIESVFSRQAVLQRTHTFVKTLLGLSYRN